MIDHRGDCNGQPCTCGAKPLDWLAEYAKTAVNFCPCSRRDQHPMHTWLRLGDGWFTCDGGNR